jgi:hypothetical protein
MGRPLKIAKAQAVLTITGTAATGNVVTVSQNLSAPPAGTGIIANMPFVVASNVGGLVAGRDYWVLKVLSIHTFTVSATPLSANPNSTPVTLSNTSAQTVAASVGVVDAYFNNPNGGTGWPATNTATYSVVGGNTAIYGKQVLCNVGFGVTGNGTVFASTASTEVVGLGTDFANVATGTILFAVWRAGAGPTQLLGTATATKGNLLVGLANCAANGVIGTVGNAQTLVASAPVVFDTAFGGLTPGTPYFVKTIANATAFTVSTAPGGAVLALSANASVVANAIQNRVVLSAVSANNASGVTGYGDGFIQVRPEPGYIVRQKGKQKYLVKGTTTGIVGQCYTANVANTALLPNTMTIQATYANAATARVQTLSDHNLGIFTSSSSPDALANIVSPGQPTGNLGYINTAPAFATFNTAYAPNTANAQPYPIVTINNA